MANLIVSNVPDYQALLDSVFGAFLTLQHISEKTRRNYQSDIRRFINWIVINNQSLLSPAQGPWLNQEHGLKVILSVVTTQTVGQYKQSLVESNTPSSTINRHLSSIRMFFRCAVQHRWIAKNPAEHIKNIPAIPGYLTNEAILAAFEKYVTEDGASKTTIRNYVTDVSEFLTWVDTKPDSPPSDL